MATTTNYGWTTPDDTALVKDGAAAIRTLGSSVDTTTKALNPSTTLGDIEYRSSTANTNTRLGIGTTGQVLSVAAGVPSWVTMGAAGVSLIDEVAFSASTSVNVNDVFSATYKCYRILITGVSDSASASILGFRLRVSGTDTTANYSARRLYSDTDNVIGSDTNPLGTDEWMIGPGTASSNGVAGVSIDLFNPFLTTFTNYNAMQNYATSASSGEIFISGGSLRDSTSYTGFTLKMNNASTGSIFVYGYAKE